MVSFGRMMLAVCTCCLCVFSIARAQGDIVSSDDLVRQLDKPRLTRGIAVSSKQSAQTESPSATIHVYFVTGSVEFADARSRHQLDELGRALTSKRLEGARVEISGHTDNVGTEAYNMDLSYRRALAVNAYLKEHFGYETDQIKGYGESRPVASNDTSQGRARNRRVVITRLD